MSSFDILVIILSIALALFLLMSIILVANLISIAKQLRRMTDAAERTMANLENITSSMQQAIAPAMLSKFIITQLKRAVSKMTDKNEGSDDTDEKG